MLFCVSGKFYSNETGTRQYSLAVWSTFAEIHSRYPYLGLLEFPVRICDAYTSQHTRDVPNLSYEYDCDLITGFCARVYMYVTYGMRS